MSTLQPTAPTDHPPPSESRFFLELLAARPTLLQGIYYVLIGLWPWLNTDSFLWATDQKADPWLVQTVGLLMAVIGLALGIAGARREESWTVCWLGLGSIAALTFCDIYFVSRGMVSSIHLVDAVLQGGLGALWFLHWQMPSGRFHPEAQA
jgi:Na+/melibiose symporter-like transporter